jgi:hypothetical protein
MRTSSEPARQSGDLLVTGAIVGGVGVGHRLHDDRRLERHG